MSRPNQGLIPRSILSSQPEPGWGGIYGTLATSTRSLVPISNSSVDTAIGRVHISNSPVITTTSGQANMDHQNGSINDPRMHSSTLLDINTYTAAMSAGQSIPISNVLSTVRPISSLQARVTQSNGALRVTDPGLAQPRAVEQPDGAVREINLEISCIEANLEHFTTGFQQLIESNDERMFNRANDDLSATKQECRSLMSECRRIGDLNLRESALVRIRVCYQNAIDKIRIVDELLRQLSVNTRLLEQQQARANSSSMDSPRRPNHTSTPSVNSTDATLVSLSAAPIGSAYRAYIEEQIEIISQEVIQQCSSSMPNESMSHQEFSFVRGTAALQVNKKYKSLNDYYVELLKSPSGVDSNIFQCWNNATVIYKGFEASLLKTAKILESDFNSTSSGLTDPLPTPLFSGLKSEDHIFNFLEKFKQRFKNSLTSRAQADVLFSKCLSEDVKLEVYAERTDFKLMTKKLIQIY